MKKFITVVIAILALTLLLIFFIPAFISKGISRVYEKSLNSFVSWCEQKMKELKK